MPNPVANNPTTALTLLAPAPSNRVSDVAAFSETLEELRAAQQEERVPSSEVSPSKDEREIASDTREDSEDPSQRDDVATAANNQTDDRDEAPSPDENQEGDSLEISTADDADSQQDDSAEQNSQQPVAADAAQVAALTDSVATEQASTDEVDSPQEGEAGPTNSSSTAVDDSGPAGQLDEQLDEELKVENALEQHAGEAAIGNSSPTQTSVAATEVAQQQQQSSTQTGETAAGSESEGEPTPQQSSPVALATDSLPEAPEQTAELAPQAEQDPTGEQSSRSQRREDNAASSLAKPETHELPAAEAKLDRPETADPKSPDLAAKGTTTEVSASADANAAHEPATSHSLLQQRLTSERTTATSPINQPQDETPRVDAGRFIGRVTRAFQAAEQRGGTIQLRLSPPELGAMKIELSVQQGTLTAKLETETAAAKSVLLDNLPALRERLAAQEIRIEKFDVDVQQQGSEANPDWQAGERDQPPHRQNATTTNPAHPESDASALSIQPTESSPNVQDGRLNIVA